MTLAFLLNFYHLNIRLGDGEILAIVLVVQIKNQIDCEGKGGSLQRRMMHLLAPIMTYKARPGGLHHHPLPTAYARLVSGIFAIPSLLTPFAFHNLCLKTKSPTSLEVAEIRF